MQRTLIAFLLLAGCFQEIDFPGEQAEIESDDVNGLNAGAVNEAVFDELQIQRIDANQDGTADFSVSLFLVMAADQDVDLLCEEAELANSLEDLANAFDDVFLAGSFVARADPVDQADGFRNGDEILGDLGNGFAVFSFFAATQDGQLEVLAEAFGDRGRFEFEDLDDTLDANFDDQLEFEFAQDNIDPFNDPPNLNADIDGLFFNAAPCDMDDIQEDFLLRRLGLQP